MKTFSKIILIFSIILIIISGILYIKYDKTIFNLHLKNIKDGQIPENGDNVLVTGKIVFSENKIKDEEYNISFPYTIMKRVKNALNSELQWVDEEPVFMINKAKIANIDISEEFFKSLINNEPIYDYTNVSFSSTKLVPIKYSNIPEKRFLSTMEEMGNWRLKYYYGEVEENKEYTIIGKIENKKIIPINSINKNLYEGRISQKDLQTSENYYIGIAIQLLIIIALVFFVIGLLMIIIIINKKR